MKKVKVPYFKASNLRAIAEFISDYSRDNGGIQKYSFCVGMMRGYLNGSDKIDQSDYSQIKDCLAHIRKDVKMKPSYLAEMDARKRQNDQYFEIMSMGRIDTSERIFNAKKKSVHNFCALMKTETGIEPTIHISECASFYLRVAGYEIRVSDHPAYHHHILPSDIYLGFDDDFKIKGVNEAIGELQELISCGERC